MYWRKYFWAIRSLLYNVTLGHVGMPGYMGKPMCIEGGKNIYIDKRVRIYPGLRMETVNSGEIHIEENVSIGQNFHCTSAGKLTISSGTTILGNVFITNIEHEYKKIGIPVLEQPIELRETKIGENCFIGYGASIQAGTVLGKQCIVGTNAVVRGTFPDHSVIVGVPARIIKKYDPEKSDWVRVDG